MTFSSPFLVFLAWHLVLRSKQAPFDERMDRLKVFYARGTWRRSRAPGS